MSSEFHAKNFDSVLVDREAPEEQYTLIRNSCLEDPDLSWAAKGLLCYVMSRPKDWRVYLHQLAEIYVGEKRGSGSSAIKSILKELRVAGYVRYIKFKNELGHWQHRYRFFSRKQVETEENFQKMIPQVVKPLVDEPPLVKPLMLQTNELQTNDVSVCVDPPPVASSPRLKKIELKTFGGKIISLSMEDLFSECIKHRKDWSADEIDELWKILEKYKRPMRDLIKFCDGTIKNLRKLKKLKEIDENQKCRSQKPSNKNHANNPDTSPSKEQPKKYKETFLVSDMPDHPLANWRQLTKPWKKS